MSPSPIVHIEFPSKDPAKTADFYAAAFGWKLTPLPEMNYILFDPESGPGGGFPPLDETMYHPGEIYIYIQVDDIEAALKHIETLGGKTLVSRMPIDPTSWMAVFADPSGTRVGLYSTNPAK